MNHRQNRMTEAREEINRLRSELKDAMSAEIQWHGEVGSDEAQPRTVGYVLADLESSLAEPTTDEWADMRAMGLERRDYVAAWRVAVRLLDLHALEVADRLGNETTPAERDRLAALGVIARLHAEGVALRWDVKNARAERDRAERRL
jgi:hypothetical protein